MALISLIMAIAEGEMMVVGGGLVLGLRSNLPIYLSRLGCGMPVADSNAQISFRALLISSSVWAAGLDWLVVAGSRATLARRRARNGDLVTVQEYQ